jgi:predicted PurR-regulated permease PerM
MTSQQVRLSRMTRGLLIASAIAILIFLAQSAQTILVPFLLAVFLAAIAAPPVMWLSRHRVPHSVAVALTALAMMLALSLVGTIVGASVSAFTARLPEYQRLLLVEITRWYDQFGAAAPETFRDLLPTLEPGAAMGIAANVLSGVSGVLGNMFESEAGLDVFREFMQKLLRYLGIKTLTSLGTGGLVTVWVWWMGVDFPVMWGLLAFLLNYVPTIGSILAAVPAVLLALILHGPGTAVVVGLGYLVINTLIGNGIEPRVMGRGLGLSPLVVFLSLVFWGWVLGPVGMFLSVPMTMTLRMALQVHEGTRWLSILLGPADVTVPTSVGEAQVT